MKAFKSDSPRLAFLVWVKFSVVIAWLALYARNKKVDSRDDLVSKSA